MAFSKSLIIIIALCAAVFNLADAQLGGLTEIEDVEHNKEVQDLGKYSVGEYNRRIFAKNLGKEKMLTFVEVVSAEKQIVSGTKYYLKIEAMEKGVKKLFESQIVVKPWMKKAPRTMLGFGPSAGN